MWITSTNSIIRQPQGIRIEDVNHPASIFWCWSKEQLAQIGVKPYQEVDGEVYERFNTEPIPQPEEQVNDPI